MPCRWGTICVMKQPTSGRLVWGVSFVLAAGMLVGGTILLRPYCVARYHGRRAQLCSALLAYAPLDGADLMRSVLTHANLDAARLRGAHLRGADLRHASLLGASLQGAVLEEARLEGADLRGASLRDARLGEADLGAANLTKADLTGANLACGDIFARSDAADHWVGGATVSHAVFRGARLRGALLEA